MKYGRARSRSMVLLHLGMCHSSVVSGRLSPLGSEIRTLWPVALTYGVSTRPFNAVDHRRASGPPPVSSARWSPLFLSYQRGLITQLYLSLKSRFCGTGTVVWFH